MSEDALLASEEGIQYNNALAQDERMGSGSDNDSSSEEEELFGDQTVDYSQLERVLVGGFSRGSVNGCSESEGQHSLSNSAGTQHGTYRAVGQVRLFTNNPSRSGSRGGRRFRASPHGRHYALSDSMSIEDITVVGSQAAASAFSPVVSAIRTRSRIRAVEA